MADINLLVPELGVDYNSPSFGNHSLDQTTDAVEWVFQAREAATLTKLSFRYGARTGTPPTYIASLQGVGTTGNPDGTIKGGGSPASVTFTPPADATWDGTWREVTLANAYTCTRGEWLSMVIGYSSGTVDGSNFSSFTFHGNMSALDRSQPYYITNNAGARTRGQLVPVFGYSSATRCYGRPVLGAYSQTFTSTTTPDELALRFLLPAEAGETFQVAGLRTKLTLPVATTTKFLLYEGTTVLQEITVDSDFSSSGSSRLQQIMFSDTTLASLAFGTVYRLAIQPQTNSSHVLTGFTVSVNDDLYAWETGKEFYLSQRTDAGAWTDVATTRPYMMPIITDWTEPAGGSTSAARRVGMGSRLVGVG